MFFQAIKEFAMNNATLFLGLFTAGIGLLSTIISLVEYFREKSYLDYFFVWDFQRNRSRSGLHPEFIALSAAIICSVTFLIEVVLPIIKTMPVILICLISSMVISLVAMVVSFMVFWFYHRDQKNLMNCWSNGELFRMSLRKGWFSFIKWIAICFVFSFSYLVYFKMNINLLIIVVSVVICIYLYIKFDYEFNKKMFSYSIKQLPSVRIDNKLYIVLTSNDRQHYCAECTFDEKTCVVFLDQIRIINISDENLQRLYFTKLTRNVHGEDLIN